MHTNMKLAAAVAGVLSSTAAFAIGTTNTPITTGTANIILNMAGSSAARDALILDMDKLLCDRNFGGTGGQAGTDGIDTLNFYKVSGNGDLRVFSCTLLPNGGGAGQLPANFTTGLGGKNVIVYYRSDGGSVWGAIGAGRNTSIIRANLDTTAGAVPAGSPGVTNDAAAYNYGTLTGTYSIQLAATTDGQTTATGSVALDTPLIGVLDVGLENFTLAANWPTAILVAGPVLTGAEVTTYGANDKTTYGQIFGIIVNKATAGGNWASTTFPIADLSLSSADIAGIFTHKYTDWSAVPSIKAAGSPLSGAIGICRRDIGSGSHVVITTTFLNTGCGRGSTAFSTIVNAASGTTPLFRSSTGQELSCVNGLTGGIGYSSYDDTASFQTATSSNNLLFLKVDGVAPGKLNAANGSYPLWEELHFLQNPTAYAAAAQLTKDFADSITGFFQLQPAPAAANGISLNAVNATVDPPVSPNWVALGGRANACSKLINAH